MLEVREEELSKHLSCSSYICQIASKNDDKPINLSDQVLRAIQKVVLGLHTRISALPDGVTVRRAFLRSFMLRTKTRIEIKKKSYA